MNINDYFGKNKARTTRFNLIIKIRGNNDYLGKNRARTTRTVH